MAPDERRDGKQQATPDSGALSPAVPNSYSGALSPSPAASLWHLNAIDREGRRNAEHIAIIVVVDLVPIQCHFREDGHRPSNHCIKTATRPQAQLKTATGQRDDGHRPSSPPEVPNRSSPRVRLPDKGSEPAWRPAIRRPPCHCTGGRNSCLNRFPRRRAGPGD